MKMTNKVLLILFVLLLSASTYIGVTLTNIIEFVPNPFKERFYEEQKTINHVTSVSISGGYDVEIYKSNNDSIKILGPDQLVEKYSIISTKNGEFKVQSKLDLHQYSIGVRIELHLKKIEKIFASGGSKITVRGLSGDSLAISTYDSSLVMTTQCMFNNVNTVSKQNSIIGLEQTRNASVEVNEKSTLVIRMNGGYLSGTKSSKATLHSSGPIAADNVKIQ